MFCCVGMEVGGPSNTGGPNDTSGSSGAGVRSKSVSGPVNQVVRRQVLRYQRRIGESYMLYSPFGQKNRPCECRHTYRYPDEIVIAIDDERRRLGKAVDTLRVQLEEAREVGHGQAMCLRDLEAGLRVEEERPYTFGRQFE